ncbi:hypothetical protein NVP1165O_20 [Vibrio phage 1.165.O._10N.261.51.B7]|nr:hypothetical protein NVP1165O_20 [Vibrio phage 1.165.O._10N.261.51.B7]AUR99469.1 hypothetical protein NVP1266O_20 [Vibrio phage 1.266.O._10N.286.52.F9]
MAVVTTDELKEVIASNVTNAVEVEVVRISDPSFPETLYLTSQLSEGAQIYDENNEIKEVTYIPMRLSDESTGEILRNERTLTIQGLNDVIAYYEDMKPTDDDTRISVDVLTYVSDLNGVLSTVAQGPYKYFNKKTTYSQKSNSATMTISTSPTNQSETGTRFSSSVFETLRGFA